MENGQHDNAAPAGQHERSGERATPDGYHEGNATPDGFHEGNATSDAAGPADEAGPAGYHENDETAGAETDGHPWHG